MPKINESITRIDFRCPNDLYQRIEALAVAKGSRINHKSGRTEISPTILDLLKVGLKFYSSDTVPDDLSDYISGTVSDKLPDNLITDEKLEMKLASFRTEIQPALELAKK